MDGLVAYAVVRREMTVSSLRHRVWILLLLCTSQAFHVPGRVAFQQVPRCFSTHCVTTSRAQGYVEMTTVERVICFRV